MKQAEGMRKGDRKERDKNLKKLRGWRQRK
jgi:hypothetical protein